MPYEDSARHGERRRRTVEHRLAGGHHRKNGCLSAVVTAVAVPVTLLILAVTLSASYLGMI